MTLKFFLLYAGIFFASSLVIMTLIKQLSNTYGNMAKKPLVFNFILSIIASGIAFGVTYITQNLFFTFWIMGAVFLFFGIITVLLIHKKYFRARRDNRNKQFFAELLFGFSIIFLCIAIFSSLQYFLKDRDFMFFPMLLSMLFFFIPLLLLHTFDAAVSLPKPQYEKWLYPEQTVDMPDEKAGEHLYVIWFEIAKKATDKNRTNFRGKAPEDMLLGDLFYHFINEYNEDHSETPIEYTNNEQPQEWMFRTKPKWYGFSKILQPEFSVSHNKIRENTIIICERMNNG